MLKRSFESVSAMLGRERRIGSLSAGELFPHDHGVGTRNFEVYRCDKDDGLLPPQVIVAEQSETEDLFATVATYHSDSSPITAFSHVISNADRSLLRGSGKVPKRKTDSSLDTLTRALLGASAGEALLTSIKSKDSAVSYALCRSSLSFALARSISVYKCTEKVAIVSERWTSLLQMSSLDTPKHLSDALLMLCNLFDDSADGRIVYFHDSSPMPFLAGTLTGDQKSNAEFRRALESSFPGIDEKFTALKGSFDSRLSTFTEIAVNISESDATQALKDISVAYFCDQILPGSFLHPGILKKIIDNFPTALIWYGAFAACSNGSNLNKAQSVLDKLKRDCSECFLFEARPQCDVSFSELEVVARGGFRAEAMRPSQKALLVALVPGVIVCMRQPEGDTSSDGHAIERRRSQAIQEAVKLLDHAAYLLSESVAGSPVQNKFFRKNRNK